MAEKFTKNVEVEEIIIGHIKINERSGIGSQD
jgi:hypothetical protein